MTQFLLKLFIKDRENTEDVNVRKKYGTLSGAVGIICNLFLCSFKIIIGIITGSISVMADGLNNLSDMGSSVVTMAGFRLAAKPADKDHPFGHGRIEYVSAFIVAMLILLVGAELIISSVTALAGGQQSPVFTKMTVIILVVSIAVKIWMFVFNRKLSREIGSESLKATAQDCLNDCIATAVIIIVAIISPLVPKNINLDAVLGVLVGVFIIYSGINSAKETINKLLGQPANEETIAVLEDIILSFSDFSGIHDLIIHNYGPGRVFASVHVEVPSKIDIVHCHEQVDLCEKTVNEKLGIELTIHYDPIDVDDERVEKTKNIISAVVEEIDSRATVHDFRMTPTGIERTNLIFDAVLPTGAKMTAKEFKEKIIEKVKEINPTFVCVITIDRDYTGR